MICYQCDKRVNYLFDDARCKKCTRLTPEEVSGKAFHPDFLEIVGLSDASPAELETVFDDSDLPF